MSLIHEALREMDTPKASSANASPGGWRQPGDKASSPALTLKPALVAVAVMAIGGGAAWWYAHGTPTQARVQPASMPAPAAPVVTAVVPSKAVVPVIATEEAAEVRNEPPALPPVAAYTKPAERPVYRKPAPPKPVVKASPAPVPAPEISLEERHALLKKAVAAGDTEGARAHLAALERRLPADSVTLLRARAWYAAHADNAADARKAYQAVLDRLPGDENAGLNLAALEAREGQAEKARLLLAEVLQANPESEAAQQALRRLKESVR